MAAQPTAIAAVQAMTIAQDAMRLAQEALRSVVGMRAGKPAKHKPRSKRRVVQARAASFCSKQDADAQPADAQPVVAQPRVGPLKRAHSSSGVSTVMDGVSNSDMCVA
jgi:hypothetical protein